VPLRDLAQLAVDRRSPACLDVAGSSDVSRSRSTAGCGGGCLALHSRLAYTTRSLNQPAAEDAEGELGQLLGGLDARLEALPDRHVLAQYVAMLPERERSIVYLRFVDDLTQREIAERLGISQMHVSRLLSGALNSLRTLLLDEP
jgi:RNA polymerase sigma-B factor